MNSSGGEPQQAGQEIGRERAEPAPSDGEYGEEPPGRRLTLPLFVRSRGQEDGVLNKRTLTASERNFGPDKAKNRWNLQKCPRSSGI